MKKWGVNLVLIVALFLVGQWGWTTVVHNPAKVAAERTTALCDTMVGLVERSNDTIRQHPYYKRHPAELPAALRQNKATLRELRSACDLKPPGPGRV